MNERIKLIAEQARKYARDYVAECRHYGHYMEHNEHELRFEEKFAELIVKECAEVIFGNEIDHPITGAVYDGDQAKAIIEHFGIEP